ncbi:hypothetical protein SeLEV6574_g03165 [Synchytrium endobioticum]|uniref:Secreted protein n=1 Tax=Synchytrium endobioticum TaxID=286115 RepID=A0A507D537_9FUNG|nr:hypothetical protein SeLEV6574_g03165 [Synchytrium endobioticum]
MVTERRLVVAWLITTGVMLSQVLASPIPKDAGIHDLAEQSGKVEVLPQVFDAQEAMDQLLQEAHSAESEHDADESIADEKAVTAIPNCGCVIL